jgi:hypothetical protein
MTKIRISMCVNVNVQIFGTVPENYETGSDPADFLHTPTNSDDCACAGLLSSKLRLSYHLRKEVSERLAGEARNWPATASHEHLGADSSRPCQPCPSRTTPRKIS